MTAATAVLASINVALLIWAIWLLTNTRDDITILKTWMSKELQDKHDLAQERPLNPVELARWLKENQPRPHKDDPPRGPGTG